MEGVQKCGLTSGYGHTIDLPTGHMQDRSYAWTNNGIQEKDYQTRPT